MSLLVGEALSFFGALADSVAGVEPEQTGRVRMMCATLGRLLELPGAQLRVLDAAAVLRNAGIFATAVDYERPASGARICEKFSGLPPGISDTVRWQCEFWDGMGYPDRLRAAEIPRTCRVLLAACRYAACTSEEQAHAVLTGQSGRMFAPDTTAAFLTWYYTRSAIATSSDLSDLEWIETVDAQNVLAVLRTELGARFRTRTAQNVRASDAWDVELAAVLYNLRQQAVPVLDRFETLRPVSRLLSEEDA
ncbi:MAG TPA: hypothetical protein VFE17_01420 [Candidatus Baltobacteraceae bacterium]|jgi:hypothetical protein|nr:hypothetical protein [Candidatus Baltobacteraceae bacterium]